MDMDAFFADARDDLAGPLEGVRVLEITTTWAGPVAGCLLADYGADVVKIEQREGEVTRRIGPLLEEAGGRSLPHEVANRGKRNLTLDLRTAAGRDVALELFRRVDVVVQNFRPGTLADWGVGYADAKRVNPALVYVSISGYGQFGPWSDRVGYDPLAQSFSGFVAANGDADGEPTKAPTYLGDDLGALHAALAALAALRHRDRTGEGQHVDVALIDAVLYQSSGHLASAAMGHAVPRMGNQYAIAVPVNAYRCADGHVFAGVLLESHWKRLAGLIGRPELAEDPRFATREARIANREEVDAMLAAWCRERTKAEIDAEFAALGLPAVPVQTYHEAAAHPHVLARGMVQALDVDGREVKVNGPVAKFSRTPARLRAPAAELGEHSDAVLEEIGLDAEQIAALKARGIV